MFCSWASAVSLPVLPMELRVRQLNVETRVVFLHLKSRQSLEMFWPVAFFSIPAWHPSRGRAPWCPTQRAMWHEEVVELLVMLFFNCFHTSRRKYDSVLVVVTPTSNRSFLLMRNGWSMLLCLTVSFIICHRSKHKIAIIRILSAGICLSVPQKSCCPLLDFLSSSFTPLVD